ncbi:MAG: cation:proton antiporter [Pseudomonadota bacterium]
MHGVDPIIKDLAVILGVAGFVTLLFQYIRQPVVLGYLVAGIIVGPHIVTHPLLNDIPNIKVIAELGVIFLMFSLGLEFSFHKLVSVGFSASITGLLEVVLMLTIGFVTGVALGWPFYDCVFLGAALSISSTTIIIKALDELHLKGKRFAVLIFGVLIVEDLLAILLLVVLSSLIKSQDSLAYSLMVDSIRLVVVVGSWFLVGYFIVPSFFRRIIDYANQETLTIISIAFCLILVCLAGYFHYSPALGAFIMGSILAETPQIHRIEELIRPIRDIFAAVFFVSVGMLINPKLIFANIGIVLLISVVTIISKIISSSMGALITGQSLSTSLRVGFGMAQIGEFSFIIVGMGMALGVISDTLYPIVVAVSVITTFTTPYLIRLSGMLASKIEKRLPKHIKKALLNYSSWVYILLADKQDSATYRRIVIRFVMNAIIVAVIFTLIDQLLAPYLKHLIQTTWIVEVVSWITAIILSSPFIWAMLFAAKWNINSSVRQNKNSFYLLLAVIWAMVLAEIVFLTFAYFYTWAIIGILFVSALVFFSLFYARLGKFYYWVEKKFLANISPNPETQAEQFNKLAPWDNSLMELTISPGTPVVGKTLQELQIRQLYNINIVAIQRGQEIIAPPRGEQELLAHDKLVVLGNDDDIDAFKGIISTSAERWHTVNLLNNFVLKPMMLNPKSTLIGKTIRDSQIREHAHGLVVGLERRGKEILNPDPATILEAGDLLLMVGEPLRLKALE